MTRHINSFRIAVFLSSLSMVFGVLREFIIVGFLGFTATNDKLQLYLSIFYTIGLTIDAMRLACLNLYSVLSLPRMLFAASIVALPFASMIGLAMSYSTSGLKIDLLGITVLGGYLNLIAALLITYKQRNNNFLFAQTINVLPNFILIPGIIISYFFTQENFLFSIVCLTSLIPVVQCMLLLLIPKQPVETTPSNHITLFASILTFFRHFTVMLGEQCFQVIARKAFYHYGIGYLSLFAMAIRIYSAARFILVDSFIGSRLANWHMKFENEDKYFSILLNSTLPALAIVILSLFIGLYTTYDLTYSCMQIAILLMFGFYFSTLVRIIYFKINRCQNNSILVVRFAFYECIISLLALLLTKQSSYSILILIWIGYIVKPFGQLLLLRKHYSRLTLNYGIKSA